MLVGLRQVSSVAVAIFCIALVLPAAALAKGGGSKCNASACKVYIEPPAPSAGKQSPPTASQNPTSPGQTGSGNGSGGTQTQQPKNLQRVLLHAGNDKAPLSKLLTESGVSPLRGGPGNVAGPSLLGSALDLGPGPLALLAILLTSALAFGVYSGLRSRQARRPSA
jgi:hypothetical protein